MDMRFHSELYMMQPQRQVRRRGRKTSGEMDMFLKCVERRKKKREKRD